MFDKEAQRQRALNQTTAFMKHGHQAPAVPAPVKKVEVPKDMLGNEIKVGQRIVRTIKEGNVSVLRIAEVTYVSGMHVCVGGATRPLTNPDRILIL